MGNAGADMFVMGQSNDVILDFALGSDHIDLSDVASFTDSTITSDGTNTLINASQWGFLDNLELLLGPVEGDRFV